MSPSNLYKIVTFTIIWGLKKEVYAKKKILKP